MKTIPLVLVFALSLPAFAEWTPPEKPDLQAILQEAHADTLARRYPDALAKHLWFHQNALKHDRAMYGVRLSFALSYWQELGDAYPPALVELKKARDDARNAVLNAKPRNVHEPFHDFTSINHTLDEDSETKSLFIELDKADSPLAKPVFQLAMPSLIEAKEYKICGKYLQPKTAFESSKMLFDHGKKLAKNPTFGAQHQEFAEKRFTTDTATLVALLKLNDRLPEAVQIATLAKKEWANDAFSLTLDQALQGVIPTPWP